MLFVALAVAVVLALGFALAARRHVAASAWNRELDRAFAVAERRDMPTRPVL